jgi:hypothetical protein
MKGPLLCVVALAGIFAYLIFFFGIFALVGVALSAVWVYAMQAIWPTLPDILWWQFSLIAFGFNLVRCLLVGVK